MDLSKIIKELKAKFPQLQDDETMDKLEAAAMPVEGMEGEESIEAPAELNSPQLDGPPPEELGDDEISDALGDADLSISIMEGEEEEMPEDEAEPAPMHMKKMKRKGGPALSNLKRK